MTNRLIGLFAAGRRSAGGFVEGLCHWLNENQNNADDDHHDAGKDPPVEDIDFAVEQKRQKEGKQDAGAH